MEPENTCCTCYYHDAKSWFCYNGLSPKGTENTDPEDTCEFYEKRNECESQLPENGSGRRCTERWRKKSSLS